MTRSLRHFRGALTLGTFVSTIPWLSACGEASGRQDESAMSLPPPFSEGEATEASADSSGAMASLTDMVETRAEPPELATTPPGSEPVPNESGIATDVALPVQDEQGSSDGEDASDENAAREEPMEEDEPVAQEPMAQPVPSIAAPGFPQGSAARLMPGQFVGPITGLPVQFNIYFPPGYDSGQESYPVLYDLHGLTDSRDTNPGPVTGSFEAAMREGVVGPMIVVFPQGFPEAYWADTRDGRPNETQVIRELVPFVDSTFRTLAHRSRRGVSGFSMGGYGALAYATKFPERFSVGIGYDSALDTWETLVGRRGYIASAAFANDESAFDEFSPWASAARNAEVLRGTVRLRGVPGMQYQAFHETFRDHIASFGIPYEHVQTECGHNYGCLMDRQGRASWVILQDQFSRAATYGAE